MLNRIENRPTSIEKETFPLIAADQKLFAQELEGYWMDVGQPRDYLTGAGTALYRDHGFPCRGSRRHNGLGKLFRLPLVDNFAHICMFPIMDDVVDSLSFLAVNMAADVSAHGVLELIRHYTKL